MPDEANPPPAAKRHTRAVQGTKRAAKKQTDPPAAPSPLPEEKSVAASAPQFAAIAAQGASTSETPAQPAPTEPPIGVRWGEFPPPERQAELAQRLQAWDQERGHEDHVGPFERRRLTGADVFWLAAYAAGKGDITIGLQKMAEPPYFNHSDLHLERAILDDAQLQGAQLRMVNLREAHLFRTQLQHANLMMAQLQGAKLVGAQLQEAILLLASLQGAHLYGARLQGTRFDASDLRGVNFAGAMMDVNTQLIEPYLDAQIQVADVIWNGVPLTRMKWNQVLRLGDEKEAHDKTGFSLASNPGEKKRSPKLPFQRLEGFEAAIRAYRQLAAALRSQALKDVADRFDYRAQILQRELLWLESGLPMPGFKQGISHPWGLLRELLWHHSKEQKDQQLFPSPSQGPFPVAVSVTSEIAGQLLPSSSSQERLPDIRRRPPFRIDKLGAYLFSLFLVVVTGYGFKMRRIIFTYILLILVFAGVYWGQDLHRQPQPFSFWQAIILSVTAFHGRVFSNPFNLSDPQIVFTALEAIVGLVIEGVFIAMLTQRFFNR